MALEEELSLDISEALSSVDELELRISQVGDTARVALSGAISGAAEEALALGDLISSSISQGIAEGASSGLAALQAQIAGIDPNINTGVNVDTSNLDALGAQAAGSTTETSVSVDTSQIQTATDELAGLTDATGNVPTTEIPVDTSQVDEARSSLEGLDEAEAATAGAPTIPVQVDASAADDAAGSLAGLTDSIEAVPQTGVEITVDDTQVTQAKDDLDALGQSEQPTVQPIEVPVVETPVEAPSAATGDTPTDGVTIPVDISEVEAGTEALAGLTAAVEDVPSTSAEIVVDDSQVTAAQDSLAGLSDAEQAAPPITIPVDTSEVEQGTEALAGLADATGNVPTTSVELPVDDTQVTGGVDALTGLTEAKDAAATGDPIQIPVDTSQIEQAESSLSDLSEAASVGPSEPITVPIDSSDVDTADQALTDLSDDEDELASKDAIAVPVDTDDIDTAKGKLADLATEVDQASTAQDPIPIAVNDEQVQQTSDELRALQTEEEAASGDVTLSVNTGEIDDARNAVEDLQADATSSPDINLNVDTTSVDDAKQEVADLADQTQIPTTTIPVDTTQVEAANQTVDDLGETIQSVSGESIEIDTSGADSAATGLDRVSESAKSAGEGGKEAEVGLAAVAGRLTELTPSTIASATAIGGIGLGLDEFVKSGSIAIEATQRMDDTFGDLRDTVETVNFDGANHSLEDLTTATGSDIDKLRLAVSSFGDLGVAEGQSQEEAAKSGQQFGLLANYIAATHPELGTAEELTTRLNRALTSGGNAARSLGLPLSDAGEIAQAASEKFGVGVDQLTTFQKESAALDLVMSRLGPNFDKNLNQGLNSPLVQLRAVGAALGNIVAKSGEQVTPDFVKTLQAASPFVETAVTSLGSLATGGLSVIGGSLNALTIPLEAVEKILLAIPSPVFATIGAFALGAKGYSLAADAASGLGTRLDALKTKINNLQGGTSISSIFTEQGASKQQLQDLADSTETLTTKQTALRESLAAVSSESAAGADALAAYDLAQQADANLADAKIATTKAEAEAETVRNTAMSGSQADLLASREAEEALIATRIQEAEATAEATAANELYQEQLATVAATGTAGAEAVVSADAEVVAANAAMTASFEAASESSIAWDAALGPVGILLGVVAAGYTLFHTGSEQNVADLQAEKQATEDALTARKQYSDSLNLTPQASAALNQDAQKKAIQDSNTAANTFLKTLQSNDQLSTFNSLKLNLGLVNRALNGNTEAAQAFRQSLVDSGNVHVDYAGIAATAQAAATAGGFVDTTGLIDEAQRQQKTYVDTGRAGSLLIGSNNGVAKSFQDQATAAQKANGSIIDSAEAETRAGGAAGVLYIQEAANLGLLNDLDPKLQAHAEHLLSIASASAAASQASDDLTESFGKEGTAAGTALDQLSKNQAPDLSGLEELRRIASDPSFTQLPQETQDLITKELQLADAAQTTAAAHGQLIDTFGEVDQSVDSLTSKLQDAAQAYLQISGAPAQFAKDQRDAEASIRDIGTQTSDLGTNLDAGSASFDAASITIDNYKDVLSQLPQATQDAINSIGQSDASTTKSAQEIAAVQQALTDLHALGQDPVQGLIDVNTKVTSLNVSDILHDLPESIQEKIKFTVDDQSVTDTQSKAEVDAQKAAATRQAVADAGGKTIDDLNSKAADNSDKLNDYFDTVGTNIRKVIGDMAEQKVPLQDIQNIAAAMVGQLTDAGEKAGLTKSQISDVIDQQRLTPQDIEIDFHSAGLDGVIRQLQILNLSLLGIPPDALSKILEIKDPTNQLQAINDAIAGLPLDKQLAIKAVLDVPSVQDAVTQAQGLTKDPVKLAIQAGVDPTGAQTALDQINAYNKANPNAKIEVSADTITATAKIDAAAKDRIATLKADDKGSAANIEHVLDQAAHDRTVYFNVQAHTDQAEADIAGFLGVSPTKLFGSDTGTATSSSPTGNTGAGFDYTTDVPPGPSTQAPATATAPSNAASAFLGSFPTNPKIGDHHIVGGVEFVYDGQPYGWVVYKPPAPGKVKVFSTGGTIGMPPPEHIHAYASGSGDDLIDAAVKHHDDMGYTSDLPPGHVNAGSYDVVGEDNTGPGEFVISQRSDQRGKNIDTLGLAASSFGLQLVPAGAQQLAPQAVSAPNQADPALLGVISDLSDAVAAHWSPQISANITPEGPAAESMDELFSRLDSMRFGVR